MDTPTVTVAYGDGFGPAVMEAALTVLREAGAQLRIETIEIGSRIYNMGSKTGILPSAWKTLEQSRILLKAPVIVPEGCRETGEVIRDYFGLTDSVVLAHADASTTIANIDKEMPVSAGMTSAWVNERFALFEPLYADECRQKKPASVDPSPMLHAAIRLLEHAGQPETGRRIHEAWRAATRDHCHMKERGRLKRMTEAVIERLPPHKQAGSPHKDRGNDK